MLCLDINFYIIFLFFFSVERLNGEQLRVVTDALNTVVARPENKGNVLYDPSSKTRIVYRFYFTLY